MTIVGAGIDSGTEIRDHDGNLIATAKRYIDRLEGWVGPEDFEWAGAKPVTGERIHPAILRALGRT